MADLEAVTTGDASIDFRRLHPLTIVIATVEHLRPLIFPMAILLLSFLGRKSRPDDFGELIGVVLGIIAIGPAILRYFTYRYAITEETLEIRAGWLIRKNRSIPLERIQNVDVKRNILHQLLRVAVLRVETASGAGAEAELSVVANSDVESLVAELRGAAKKSVARRAKVEGSNEAEFEEVLDFRDVPEPPPAVYTASLRQLFVAGATENKAGAIILLLIGFLGQPGARTVERVVDSARDWKFLSAFSSGMMIAVATVAVYLLLVLVGWIYSIVGTVLQQYGFTLRSEGDLLTVQRGLTTQHRSVVPLRRIQALLVREPRLQRWLGYAQVQVSAAAAFDDKAMQGMLPLCPIIERDGLTGILQLAAPGVLDSPTTWRGLHPKAIWISIRGLVLFWVLVVAVIGAGMRAADLSLADSPGPFRWFIGIILLLGFLSTGLSAMRIASTRWGHHAGYLYLRYGWWSRQTHIVPDDRVQYVYGRTSPAERRAGAKTLTIHTAAAGTHAMSIPHLKHEDADQLIEILIARSATMAAGV